MKRAGLQAGDIWGTSNRLYAVVDRKTKKIVHHTPGHPCVYFQRKTARENVVNPKLFCVVRLDDVTGVVQ